MRVRASTRESHARLPANLRCRPSELRAAPDRQRSAHLSPCATVRESVPAPSRSHQAYNRRFAPAAPNDLIEAETKPRLRPCAQSAGAELLRVRIDPRRVDTEAAGDRLHVAERPTAS